MPLYSIRASPPSVTADDYEVYKAFLRAHLDKAGGTRPRVSVIHLRTRALSSAGHLKSQLEDLREECPGAPASLWTAFGDLDEAEVELQAEKLKPLQCLVASDDQINSLFETESDAESSTDAFYRHLPGASGTFAFSRIAYDRSGDWAVFYVSHWCGHLCGVGKNVICRRSSAGWQQVCSATVWVS